jgi:hypothetical protein
MVTILYCWLEFYSIYITWTLVMYDTQKYNIKVNSYIMVFSIYQSFVFLFLCISLILPSGKTKIAIEFHFYCKIYSLKTNKKFHFCIYAILLSCFFFLIYNGVEDGTDQETLAYHLNPSPNLVAYCTFLYESIFN